MHKKKSRLHIISNVEIAFPKRFMQLLYKDKSHCEPTLKLLVITSFREISMENPSLSQGFMVTHLCAKIKKDE